MRDLGIEKLANPSIWLDYRASLGSATHFNGLPPLPAALSNTWTIKACTQEAARIAGAICVAPYFAVRWTLRYFPPDILLAFLLSRGSAITLQTLSKPKATTFEA
jgi:hypothetical protein